MVKIAVLDDFIGNAAGSADWSRLQADASVDFLREHLSEEAAVEELREYEIVVTMRQIMVVRL